MFFSRILLYILVFTYGFCAYGQPACTRGPVANKIENGLIMLVPFEPKMYMSEIDQKVNKETKWNFNQIRENFRRTLDTELHKKLNEVAPTITFYSDSVKKRADLRNLYQSTTVRFANVDKKKQAAGDSLRQTKKIQNGQLVVEMSDEKKYSTISFIKKDILTHLNNKYKVEYFVFVNELDIINDQDSYNITTDTYNRILTVHYSIFDKAGKDLNSGLASTTFSSKENNPEKISKYFSVIAEGIAGKAKESLKLESSKNKVQSTKY